MVNDSDSDGDMFSDMFGDMFSDMFRSSRGELFMFLAESHTPCLVGLLAGEAANLSE